MSNWKGGGLAKLKRRKGSRVVLAVCRGRHGFVVSVIGGPRRASGDSGETRSNWEVGLRREDQWAKVSRMVWGNEEEGASFYSGVERAEGMATVDDRDGATAREGHGRRQGTAQCVIAFVTEVLARPIGAWGCR